MHMQNMVYSYTFRERGGIPLVMIALVWGGTLNSSAANLRTAVNGAASGTLNLKEKKSNQSIEIELQNRNAKPQRKKSNQSIE